MTVLILSIVTLSFGAEYYVYYNSLVPVYRSLYQIEPFFDYTRVVKFEYDRPNAELVKIRDGRQPVILVHGIDPWEIEGVWTLYKKQFIENWKRLLPSEYGLYIFVYPSLDVPIEQSANVLAQEILKLGEDEDAGKINIYAHSMGGLVVRYALVNLTSEEIKSRVNKIVFAGTPHIGSPFANLIVMDKKILKFHPKWDLLKSTLIAANTVGSFIEAPNYSYLIFGKRHPPIPKEVEFANFGGVVSDSPVKVFRNSVETNFLTTQGLNFLTAISKVVYGLDSDFSINDGMVPLNSAVHFGNAQIFSGYDHADFILSDIIINEAINYFYYH
ncbi:MAG TPA: alpha/beta hydrolase [Fervidobacterium sp.]|nr:alpha/beta hydrolase [Fervidobacterium sp.]HOH52762.1 alpha/beta hydrolase [Fervidobacterium sp.]HQQ17948.1 alpha/beta hydrolase [Fervidobacterium sp.]